MKVQQELMRHASIHKDGERLRKDRASTKRETNGKVVEMVLKPMKASAINPHSRRWEFMGVCR